MKHAFFIVLLFSCHRAPEPPSHRGFYAWKTTWQPQKRELQALSDHRVDRLYLRVFDLGWRDGRVRAQGQVRLPESGLGLDSTLRIVPVVYLENEVLRQTPDVPSELATRLLDAIETALPGIAFDEAQLDCDWSDSTQSRYFEVVEAFRSRLHAQGRTLSVTIRLHQVKFRERTGVPSADRGVLMLYNLESVAHAQSRPFIFSSEVASRYLERLAEYPLPLDLALPIFGSVAVFRGGEALTLLPLEAAADLGWLTTRDRWKTTVGARRKWKGFQFEPGDRVIVERISDQRLAEAVSSVAGRRVFDTVILFSLDEVALAGLRPSSISGAFSLGVDN